MIPPQGMQSRIIPYSVKLATALVHENESDNLTKDTEVHSASMWELSSPGTLTVFSLIIYYKCSVRYQH